MQEEICLDGTHLMVGESQQYRSAWYVNNVVVNLLKEMKAKSLLVKTSRCFPLVQMILSA